MAQQISKTILINEPTAVVWNYLTNPNLMKQWMGELEMEIDITTDWKVGNSILIKGIHHFEFENKGTILKFEPYEVLCYTHLSSISNLPDKTENYTIIEFSLTPIQNQTSLTLKIYNFPTESIFKHLDFYWRNTIEVIKGIVENQNKK